MSGTGTYRTCIASAALLIGLPLAGVVCTGQDAALFLEFPPRTQYVEHAPFSWPVFIFVSAGIAAAVLPFLLRVLNNFRRPAPAAAECFPWWGWAGLLSGALAWVLAWTRFDWFEPLQRHTFTPLWLSFIVVVNALTFRRTGRCLMTNCTAFFLKLFPADALFWWLFEYLNRFVQNWYYTACGDFSAWQYLLAATLSFSTVLPAVLSVEEWLASTPRSAAGLERFVAIRVVHPRRFAGAALPVSAAGLFLIGIFPDQLFPLLWIAPLILLVSFQCLEKRPPFFPNPGNGDWRRVFRFALAALICGFFWEMWNMYSLAKWIYTVPYVNRFHLFEMPVLGYSGYLPFGLECAAAVWLLDDRRHGAA
jgi:hypothetical protein